MEKINDMEIHDLCLYLREEKVLVLSDIHMGYEEAMNKEGVLVPRFQYKETIKRLTEITKGLDIDKIIILGDIKHEFGIISETEWRHTLTLLDFLQDKCKEIILIRGNHDTILGPIAKKRDVEVVDSYVIGNKFFCHGDKVLENDSEVVIIGHEHPAISLEDNGRVEKFKCFLKGKHGGKELVVLPSFNVVTEGTNISNEKMLSPYLQQDLSSFETWLVSDKVYYFGKVKDLM